MNWVRDISVVTTPIEGKFLTGENTNFLNAVSDFFYKSKFGLKTAWGSRLFGENFALRIPAKQKARNRSSTDAGKLLPPFTKGGKEGFENVFNSRPMLRMVPAPFEKGGSKEDIASRERKKNLSATIDRRSIWILLALKGLRALFFWLFSGFFSTPSRSSRPRALPREGGRPWRYSASVSCFGFRTRFLLP